MDFDAVMLLIGRWGGTVRYFPSDPDARFGIAEEVAAMCSSIEQVEWLVRRLPKLYTDWPAIKEVRAVLCSRFTPRDGVEAYSEVYRDGIPSEREVKTLALPDPRSRELPPGEAGDIVRSLLGRKSF